MKIGLIGFNINSESGKEIVEIAQIAEAAGVESLWTFEHVMVPLEYQSRYPYTANGRMAVIPETVMVDPLIGLAGVAAATCLPFISFAAPASCLTTSTGACC